MTERIKALKKNIVRDKYEIVCTHYKLFTESWKANEGQPDVIRTAMARSYALNHMPIGILPGEMIAVRPATVDLGIEADFCWRGCWTQETIDTLKNPDDWRFIQGDTEKDMLELSEYWHKYATDYKMYKMYDKNQMMYRRSGFQLPRITNIEDAAGGGLAVSCFSMFPQQEYTNIDYGYVLGKGLQAIIDEAKETLANTTSEMLKDPRELKKYYSRQAMIIINEGVISWMGRYADLAAEMAAKETDPKRKKELLDMEDTCRRIPANPCKTFLDALTFQWMIITLVNGMNTTPIGRIDQWAYPYYKADIEAGRLDHDSALELLESYRLKFMQIKSTTGGAHAQKWSGQANWRGMTISGTDSEGNDTTNELSYLLLEAAKDCQTPFPTISARVHEKTPEKFLLACIDLIKTGIGYPSMVGDKSYEAFLVKKGVPIERARQWYVTGCVDVNGPETYSELFATSTTALSLDTFLHRGWSPVFNEQVAPDSGDPRDCKTFDEFFEKWKQHNKFYYDGYAIDHTLRANTRRGFMEDVFTVSLFSDGVKQGVPWLDRVHPYKTGPVIGIGVGTINLAQSMYVIKKLVYDEKKITMDRLIKALDENWEGEENQKIRNMCISLPQYGNNEDEPDAMAAKVYNALVDVVESTMNYRGQGFNAGALSITAHEPGGKVMGATPDGRYSTAILADGAASPIQGKDTNGPTGAFMSAAKLPTDRMTSALFNMKFSPSTLKTEDDCKKLASALKVFFNAGGKQVQFNVVSNEEMKAAQKNPQEHKDLIVRVAGYSTYFTLLTPTIQNELISRTTQAF